MDSSKLKEFADDNFKLDEIGRKFSKRVENTVGKGEIFPFPTVFLKDMHCRHLKTRAWERVKPNVIGTEEIFHQDNSNEYPQHRVWKRNHKFRIPLLPLEL